MKTIAVLNFKGGVGKTVTTATLAYLLAKQGKRILLIDGDSQGNLSMSFGIDAEEGADTLALLTEGAGYYPEFVTPTIFDGIDLIPSDINLLVADRHMAQSGVGRMQRAIADLRDAIEEDADQDNAYDLILIDCPPLCRRPARRRWPLRMRSSSPSGWTTTPPAAWPIWRSSSSTCGPSIPGCRCWACW